MLLIAGDRDLRRADTLATIVPVAPDNRGWPNHVPLKAPARPSIGRASR